MFAAVESSLPITRSAFLNRASVRVEKPDHLGSVGASPHRVDVQLEHCCGRERNSRTYGRSLVHMPMCGRWKKQCAGVERRLGGSSPGVAAGTASCRPPRAASAAGAPPCAAVSPTGAPTELPDSAAAEEAAAVTVAHTAAIGRPALFQPLGRRARPLRSLRSC